MTATNSRSTPVTTAVSAASQLVHHTRRRIGRYAIALVVCFGIVLILDRRPPVHINKLEVIPNHVLAGDDLHLVTNVTVNRRNCEGTVLRMIVSETAGQPIQLYDSMPLVYGSPNIQRSLHVPHGFAVGRATYQSTLIFKCNPLQYFWPIKITAPTAEFFVDPPVGPRVPSEEEKRN